MQEYDPITLEILWSRLITIANETAATLVRTSFSTIVRESKGPPQNNQKSSQQLLTRPGECYIY